MKKTLTVALLIIAVVLGIGLPSAVFADTPPSVAIEKYVSVDNGATWDEADVVPGPTATVGDAVQFKVVVTNTGDVTIYNIVVTDADLTFTFDPALVSLAPWGGSAESEVVTVTAQAGQQYNEAHVNATTTHCGPVSDCDGAYYFGEERGAQGLTPGYWKNHLEAWVGYDPGDSFEGTFGVDIVGPDITLLQALETGGGKFIALDRHAAAALLNAASPLVEYPYTVAEVIAMVQDAYATGDWSSAKDNLEDANELGVD